MLLNNDRLFNSVEIPAEFQFIWKITKKKILNTEDNK